MSTLYLIKKRLALNYNTFFTRGIIPITRNFSSKKKDASSDENKVLEKQQEKEKSQEALNKLNKLLMSMSEEGKAVAESKLNLAQPRNKRQKVDLKSATPTRKSKEQNLVKVVEEVAKSIDGDPNQVQSELLQKLLDLSNHSTPRASASNLSDIVKGMEVEKTKAEQVRNVLESKKVRARSTVTKPITRALRPQEPTKVLEKIDLFGSQPLGIFKKNIGSEGVQNTIWDELYKKDLKLAVTHPPSNYFQQMILWTEQEKIWKFPIDNEQGLTEEKKVYFTEHIFLEKHLEPWCPKSGPLRHFMELVCVGLSKNPYLTVEMKKAHILWFKNYFHDKSQLLKETGVLVENATPQITEPKL